MENGIVSTGNAAGLISLRKFHAEIGVSHVTAWRWTKRGWITPINICGKPYLSAENVAEFNRRAAAGEFSKPHHGAAVKIGGRGE